VLSQRMNFYQSGLRVTDLSLEIDGIEQLKLHGLTEACFRIRRDF
jgi:hypothetical protein